MVFNSLSFIPFFIAVTLVSQLRLGWTSKRVLLTLLSYAFYAAWHPRTIVLLWASTLLDYVVTTAMARTPSLARRRGLLLLSLLLNLGFLGFFKYGAFLARNLNHALSTGWQLPVPHVELPVGISFYTFMSLAFVIDVYRGRAEPPRSFLNFALFLTFYPHLVAGPIVRSQDFLPQLEQPREATRAQFSWGLVLLSLGLFEKMALSDGMLAPIVDRVFVASHVGFLDAWTGALAFSGQIFCDFAGYSTSAIGAAACLGFVLPRNFINPYSARGFSDFWQRWHVSLSSWLRDYLYISLGGNRRGSLRTLANLMTTMLLGGLWHGASWMFVIWGALHGVYLCLERGARALTQRSGWRPPAWIQVAVTFVAVTFAWVYFRAPELGAANRIVSAMLGRTGFGHTVISRADLAVCVPVLGGILLAQNLARDLSLDEIVDRVPAFATTLALAALLFGVAAMSGDDRSFIYFQF